jgi:hypothetical protein
MPDRGLVTRQYQALTHPQRGLLAQAVCPRKFRRRYVVGACDAGERLARIYVQHTLIRDDQHPAGFQG